MAELPVAADRALLHDSVAGPSFLRGFASLPMLRQVGLMLGLAASVALGFAVVLWMREPEYKPLTGITSPYQANQVSEVLQAEGIPYRLDSGTGMLLVPAASIHDARMKIAGADIGGGAQVGFELLDRDQGFGVSQFMETAMYRRSLEGELARSITSIQAVHQARVHLAIPKATAFLRDQRRPSASVTVTLAAGQSLSQGQVRAIMNLVAGAVPELAAEQVTVVDQAGHLLSGQDDDEAFESTDRQLRYVKQIESKLTDKIHNMLLPTVGANRFMAEVAADVDFTWVEETEELFNPDLPALRSEQTVNEQRVGEGADGGVPGALSNQPPAVATAPETAQAAVAAAANPDNVPRRSRNQATRNFELDRTVSHTRHQVGRLTRLTVSVVLDDQRIPGKDGAEPTYAPWDDAELERLSSLIKNAIGYSAARGDTVSVVNRAFQAERQEEAEPVPFWMQAWFQDLVKQGLGALLVLALLFGLLRPLFKTLSKAGAQAINEQTLARIASMNAGGPRMYEDFEGARGRPAGLLTGGAPYQNQLSTVRGLVAEDPARVAQVVKHWVTKDE
jgi:flagellar M-ring protein FliF